MTKVTMVLIFDCLCSISSRFHFSNSIINHYSRFILALWYSIGEMEKVVSICVSKLGLETYPKCT